uniref:Uncharacterized protein n=1 Tax=viral metagenome TaxID=1070528 RepID=A0A6C0H2S3_9ZZZZ
MTDKKLAREKLSEQLKSILLEKKLNRSSKIQREETLTKTLASFGIDKDKLKEDLERIKKQGGMEINMKK